MIGSRLAHYRITAKLGSGGMGEVYRAEDTKLGRDVAIKLLPEEWATHPERLARFKREAKTVAALSHPNIVTLFSVEEADGVHFLTMELVEGRSLDRLIPAEGLALERFFEIASPIADAVASAHARGIVHRDLKPGNVMVTDEGQRVKVLDFGLAKPSLGGSFSSVDSDSEIATFTRTAEGVIVGTPHYMSPEQARGDTIDQRSDIFSLGVLLYEMATGERPFKGNTSIDLLSAVLKDQPPSVNDVRAELPRHLGRVVARCLEKVPDDRYQTARDVFNELRALRRETSSGSRPAMSSSAASEAPAVLTPAPASGAPSTVPWIAVRTLECRANDPDLEALADGLTEDLTTGLSRFPYLQVISHNSARALDGRALDVREVGRELGARYVMEGSLRRARSRVRIAVNLIDAQTGTHLWTETYDRDLDREDLFELQDEITDRVVATLADPHGTLTRALAQGVGDKPPESLSAHEAILRFYLYRQRVSAEDHLRARIALEHAAERHPSNAEILAALALLVLEEANHDFNPRPDALERSLQMARRAVGADTASQAAHFALAQAHFYNRDVAAFRTAAERALQLNPRSTDTMAMLGILLGYTGAWQRGRELTTRAMELNPHHPGWYRFSIFLDAYRQDRYDEALEIAQQMNMPEYWGDPLARTVAHAQLGNVEAAKAAATDLLRVWPEFEKRYKAVGIDPWLYSQPEVGALILDGLAKAGLEVVIDETTGERAVTSSAPQPAIPTPPSTASSSTPGSSAAASGEAAAPRSLAVLPLANLSGDPEQEFFVAGMHDALIAELAKIGALTVISRTSVMRFKDSELSIPEIATQLDIDAVIEGTVLRAGDRVRISLQLIQAEPEKHLWTEGYERDLTDVLGLHGEVATAVADAISTTLTSEERQRLARERDQTITPEAYERYLRGNYLNPIAGDEGGKAIRYLRQVIEEAPDFAPAYSSLARRLVWFGLVGYDNPSVVLPEARQLAVRAHELDPDSGDALAVLAYVTFVLDWNWHGARDLFDRALELEPGNVQALVDASYHRGAVGHWEEGDALLSRALEIDPFSANARFMRGWVHLLSYRFDEALAIFEATFEADPSFDPSAIWISFIKAARWRDDEALEWARKAEAANPEGLSRDSILVLGWIYSWIGADAEAQRFLDRSRRLSSEPGTGWWSWAEHYRRGDKAKALELLEETFEQRHPLLVVLPLHPIFAEVRADPDFERLVEGLGLEIRVPEGMTEVPAGLRAGLPDPRQAEPSGSTAATGAHATSGSRPTGRASGLSTDTSPTAVESSAGATPAPPSDQASRLQDPGTTPASGIDLSLDPKAIAVLPFANLSADAENEFFADGVTEDILTRLSTIRDLRVISRTSAMSYKGSDKSLRDIAYELGVGSVVEGSVRRAGNKVRIVAQLIDARRDLNLWAETYDRDLDDVFAIQSDVAESIAQALQTRLAPELVERMRQRPTENMEAYDLYLKGRQNVRTLRAPEMARGIEQLEEAIGLDASFAKAHAQLAVSHLFSAYWGARRGREDYVEARHHAERALELDPSSVLARVALGGVRGHADFDWPGAIEDFEEATRLDPTEPEAHFWHGLTLFLMGRFDEAVSVHRKARSRDPQSPNVLAQLTISLCLAGHQEEAQRLLREGIEQHPTFFALPHFLAIALLLQDRFDEAATWIERTCELTERPPLFEARQASILRLAGEEDRARAIVDRLKERLGEPPGDEVVRALTAMAEQDVGGAVRYLGDAVDQQLPLALWLLRTFHESELPRDEPAVAALYRRLWPEPGTTTAAGQAASGMISRSARRPTPSTLGSTSAAVRRTPLVGRDAERETLDQMLDATREGRGGLVLLGGEPGVGKTRLASEVLEDARQRGMLALEGHAYEDRGAPFVTASEILQEMVRVVPSDELRRMLGDNASEISRVLPELRRIYSDIPEPADVPPEQRQRYLFDSLLEFLTRSSAATPMVMLLDDVHWADESSLLLLEHVAPRLAELPILLIGTYRDAEADMSPAFEAALANLVRQRLVERLHVKQLGEEAVAELLASLGGSTPPNELVTAMHHSTEGNAFFIEEVFRHLSEEGALFDERGRWRDDLDLEELDVPEGVRLVTGRRLQRLSDPTRQTLAMAAAMGLRFDTLVLEAATGDPDATLDAIDEAEAARLVLPTPGAQGTRYEFTHALVRQTLLDDLSVPRLQRQHLTIAEAIEEVHGGRIEEHAGEMARHLLAAGPRAEAGRTGRFLALAGDRTLASAAPDEAVAYYSQALALDTDLAPADRAELLYKRGSAQRSLGRWDEAAADWQEALPALESAGETDLVTRTCHALALRANWQNRTDEAITIAERGLASAGDEPGEGRCRLLAIMGHAYNNSCRFEKGDALLSEAIALAEELGDEQLLGGEVLQSRQYQYQHTVRPRMWLEVSERAMELTRRSGRPWDLSGAIGTSITAFPYLAQFERARALADEVQPLAAREGDIGSVAHALMVRGSADFAGGDFDAALRGIAECTQLFRDADLPWSSIMLSLEASIKQLQGDWSGAREDLEEAVASPLTGTFEGSEPAHLLRHLAYVGDEGAPALLEQLSPLLPRPGKLASFGSWCVFAASLEATALLGRRDETAALYPLLSQLKDDGAVWFFYEGTGLIERLAGMAAAAGRNWALAEEHFEAALKQADELPVVPEQTLVRYWYGRALLDRAGAGDRERARELLAEALTRAESSGLRGLTPRIEESLAEFR